MNRLLLVLLLLTSACSKKDGKPAAESDKTKPKSADTCEAEVSELRTWLARLNKEGGRARPTPAPADESDVNLVASDAALPDSLEPAIAVALNSEMVSVEGQAVSLEIGEKLTSFLLAVKAEVKKQEGSDNKTLVVLVDSKTSWKRVVATAEASAAAGYTRLGFALRGPPQKSTLPAPPASSMHNEIMDYAAMQEARAFARDPGEMPAASESEKGADAILNERITADCPQVVAQFASVAEADPDKRKAHLLDGMADAIQACGCTADIIPILKEVYWHTMAWSGGPTTKFATIVLDPEGVTVSASSDATWQEVHSKILELASGDKPPGLVLKVE